MISKFLSKLKSILFKSAATSATPLKKEKKLSSQQNLQKQKQKQKQKKNKSKNKNSKFKKNIETLTTLPGVGAKSAKALMRLGLKQLKLLLKQMKKIFYQFLELV